MTMIASSDVAFKARVFMFLLTFSVSALRLRYSLFGFEQRMFCKDFRFLVTAVATDRDVPSGLLARGFYLEFGG
jgi:hypothetical protein